MSLLRLITFRQSADEYRPVPTNGLILYYDIANSSCYSGTGTVINDLSSNNYTGTIINNPTYTTDDGGALIFSGGQQIILPQTVADNFSTSEITIFTTFTVSAVTSKPDCVSFNGAFNFFYPGNRLTNDQTIEQLYWASNTGWRGSIKKDYNLNQWYTMAWTISAGTSLSFFVDNQQNGTATIATFLPQSNTQTRIGNANAEFHAGKIQSVIIYNRVLTQQELTDLHNTFVL